MTSGGVLSAGQRALIALNTLNPLHGYGPRPNRPRSVAVQGSEGRVVPISVGYAGGRARDHPVEPRRYPDRDQRLRAPPARDHIGLVTVRASGPPTALAAAVRAVKARRGMQLPRHPTA